MKQALRSALKWPLKSLLLCMIADALFFVVYGFLTTPLKDKIMAQVMVIGGLAAQQVPDTGSRAVQSGRSIVAMLLTQPDIAPYAFRTLLLLVLLAVASFVIYCLFQACGWYLAHKSAALHSGLAEYVAYFTRLNLWWAVLFFLYSGLSLLVAMRAAVLNTLYTQTDVLGITLTIFAVIVALFAVWTYARQPSTSGWRGAVDGVKWAGRHWKRTIPATVLVVILFIIVNYIIIGLSFIASWLAIGLGGLLTLLATAYARLFIITIGREHAD